MRGKNRSWLIYCCVLLAMLSLPASFSNRARGVALSSLAPVLRELVDLKLLMKSPFQGWKSSEEGDLVRTQNQEIERLLLENQLLGNEVERLKELVEQEFFIFQQIIDDSQAKAVSKKAVTRHQAEMLKLFHLSLLHMPARVIFRPLNSWNNTLWIDKGSADNQSLGRQVIAKNSPIVIGLAVVGVVDEVYEHESLVRLISDSGLNPSVRVQRGDVYLAKGELAGLTAHQWRHGSSLLKGVGFNYDFADGEGIQRDLRSNLVQPNDLLVTTGMDGVFPKGLQIGKVKKIYSLKEGDFNYTLEAEACAGDLNQLSLVFILPACTTN